MKKSFVLVVLTAYVAYKVINTPESTQQIGRIWYLAQNGLAGDEKVDEFDEIYASVGGNNQQHSLPDADVADSFYNLASDFFEYGWGDSFHFGYRKIGEPHSAAIANSQNFIANRLHVSNMDRVLDLGCGIGGPLRGIIRATGANITGLTINQHQVNRGYELCKKETKFIQDRCHFAKQDYLNITGFEENAYDAAFYMESSLHTEDRAKTFKETFRLLKPGGRLVALEYVLLPPWNPNNPHHNELMRMHLHGNGCAKTPTIEEDLAFFRAAGFEIKEHFDVMEFGAKIYGEKLHPWWKDLQWNTRFDLPTAHPLVRWPLPYLLKVLALIGLVPEDVYKASVLLNEGGDGLSGLGKIGAITPQYYVLAIKPKSATNL